MTRLRLSAARLLVILAATGALSSCLRDPQARIDRERTETFDLLTKGQQLKTQGDLVLARDTFLKAAEKSPDRPILFYEIGNCHYQLGNAEQAEIYYEKALALAPDYSLAKAELDLVRQQLKNATPPAAEKAVAAVPPPASPIETPIATAPVASFTPTPTPEPKKELAPKAEPTPEAKQIAEASTPRPTPTPEPTKAPKPKATEAPAEPPPAVTEPTPTPEPTATSPAIEETPVPAVAPEATPEPSEPVATPEPTPALKVKDVFEEEKKPAAAPSESAKGTKADTKKSTAKKSGSIDEPKDGPVGGPFGGIQKAFSGLAPGNVAPDETPAPVQPGEARKVIFPELTTDRLPTAAEDRAAALRAEELGYSDEAVRAWRRYLMREPDDISARLSLGSALQRSGRSLRAEEEFDVAQKLAPENATVYFERGNFHVRAKELVKAQACFTKTIELDPNHLRAKNNLGAVQQQLGNHSAALEVIREVLDEDPAFASAWLNLALAQDDAGLPPADVITSIENYLRLSKAPDPKTERWLTELKKKVAVAR